MEAIDIYKEEDVYKVALISVMTIFTMTVITENVKLYTVQHNLAENLDIYFSFDEREEENIKIQPKDFEWLKDTQVQYSFYQLTHDFFDFNSKVHLEMPDIEEQIDDQSWLSVEGSTIYCLNDDIKQQFQITDLKPGQVVLTSAYVNRCSIQENEITYGKETYNIHQIVPSDTKDMIIMCKEDYQKFGNLNEYQEVIIRFDNIQQKNQFLLSYPQEICDLSNRYSLTKHYVNMLYDNDEPLLANYTIERILLIAMMAVIYIYQFGFELLKQRENIGTYQLLGLTKNEIWSIYFYKALMVVGIGMTIGTVYHLLDYYYMTRSLSSFAIVFAPTTLLLNFVITLVLFICILVVSLLPMFSITKRFGLENKNIRE